MQERVTTDCPTLDPMYAIYPISLSTRAARACQVAGHIRARRDVRTLLEVVGPDVLPSMLSFCTAAPPTTPPTPIPSANDEEPDSAYMHPALIGVEYAAHSRIKTSSVASLSGQDRSSVSSYFLYFKNMDILPSRRHDGPLKANFVLLHQTI